MAVTNFKTAIPYNSIRLSQDVGNWVSGDFTYADFNSRRIDYQVAMSDLQKASSSTPSVIQGNVATPNVIWQSARYGIAAIGNESSPNGVYDGAVDNTDPGNPWVNTRDHDLSANPSGISLGELAGVDFTGAHPGSSLGFLDVLNNGSTRAAISTQNTEACTTFPFFATTYNDDGVRKLLTYRTTTHGDRYSSYAVSNYKILTLSNVASTPTVVPFTSSSLYGGTNGVKGGWLGSYARSTTNTAHIVGQANSISFNTGGAIDTDSWSTAIQGSQSTVNTGQSNAIPASSTYVDENIVAILKCRGGGQIQMYLSQYIGSGVSFGSGVNLGTSVSYGGNNGQVVSTGDDFSTKYIITAYTTNRSSFNSEVRLCRFTHSGTTLTKATESTIVTASNSVKSARLTILATESNKVWIMVMYSDTAGDLQFKLVSYLISTDAYTVEASGTYQFNDTGLDNRMSISTLTKVKKTALSYSGTTFTPGQANNFKNTVYFMVGASAGTDAGPGALIYAKANLTDKSITFLNYTAMEAGTHPSIAVNQYGESSRKSFFPQSSQQNIGFNERGTAGPYWQPIVYNTYNSGTAEAVSLSVGGLDKYFSWKNFYTTDPGSTFYNANDLISVNAVNYTEPETTGPVYVGTGIYSGNWKVYFGSADQYHPYTTGYGITVTSADFYTTTGFASVDDTDEFILILREVDADGNNWRTFFNSYILPFIASNGYLDIEIETDTKDSGKFRLNPGTTSYVQYSPFWVGLIVNTGTNGSVTNYTGDSWAFTQPVGGADVIMTVKFHI